MSEKQDRILTTSIRNNDLAFPGQVLLPQDVATQGSAALVAAVTELADEDIRWPQDPDLDPRMDPIRPVTVTATGTWPSSMSAWRTHSRATTPTLPASPRPATTNTAWRLRARSPAWMRSPRMATGWQLRA